jgi:hypothetical protein
MTVTWNPKIGAFFNSNGNSLTLLKATSFSEFPKSMKSTSTELEQQSNTKALYHKPSKQKLVCTQRHIFINSTKYLLFFEPEQARPGLEYFFSKSTTPQILLPAQEKTSKYS